MVSYFIFSLIFVYFFQSSFFYYLSLLNPMVENWWTLFSLDFLVYYKNISYSVLWYMQLIYVFFEDYVDGLTINHRLVLGVHHYYPLSLRHELFITSFTSLGLIYWEYDFWDFYWYKARFVITCFSLIIGLMAYWQFEEFYEEFHEELVGHAPKHSFGYAQRNTWQTHSLPSLVDPVTNKTLRWEETEDWMRPYPGEYMVAMPELDFPLYPEFHDSDWCEPDEWESENADYWTELFLEDSEVNIDEFAASLVGDYQKRSRSVMYTNIH